MGPLMMIRKKSCVTLALIPTLLFEGPLTLSVSQNSNNDLRAWVCLGAREKGVSHFRDNTVCQDSLAAWPLEHKISRSAIMAVADGHGDCLHSRSDVAAYLAVRCAAEVFDKLLTKPLSHSVNDKLRTCLSKHVPQAIHKNWRRRVLRHLAATPLQASDFERLGEKKRNKLIADPFHAYGTTLLAGVVTPNYLALVRIGDGVIVTCDNEGKLLLPFQEEDEETEETVSLCDPIAVSYFQTQLIPFDTSSPALVLLSSDGFQKSCGTINEFLPWVAQFHQTACSKTLDEFHNDLIDTVQDRAKTAGDDLTLGLFVRSDVLKEKV